MRSITAPTDPENKDDDVDLAEEIWRLFARFGGVELEAHPPTPDRPPPELPDDWDEDA